VHSAVLQAARITVVAEIFNVAVRGHLRVRRGAQRGA
jgi:hypothetical protein